jgi:hypothetical protein
MPRAPVSLKLRLAPDAIITRADRSALALFNTPYILSPRFVLT